MNVRVGLTRLKYHGKCLILLIFVMMLISCRAEIEPSAANSASAIIAILGEYMFAIFVLILCSIVHIIRTVSLAIVSFSCFMILTDVTSNMINPKLALLVGGILLIVSLFVPSKIYTPHVIISKNVKRLESKAKENKRNIFLCEVGVGLLVGVVLLVIENYAFR